MKRLKDEIAQYLAREIEPGEVLVFRVGHMNYVVAPTSKVPVVIEPGDDGEDDVIDINGEFTPEERTEAVRSLHEVLSGDPGTRVDQLIGQGQQGRPGG